MNTNPQYNPYGDHLPMNVMQEMSHGNPARIPINGGPAVSSSGLTSFTRPRSSDSAPVRGQDGPFNVGNTPTMRFTGHTAQTSGMRVVSSYNDRNETSAPPSRDLGCRMSIPSFHQSRSSPEFPSIHQAQSLISMQSSHPAKLSPRTSSFDRFEHTMGASSPHPNQSTNFIQNPYHSHLQPSVGTLSSVQGGHSSGSTCIYESAPTVGISGRSHYDLAPPTISDMCTASYDQVQSSFITSDFDGYEHTMGVSISYPNQPQVSMQNPYNSYLQPSIGAPSSVQRGHLSGSTCIHKSTPSIDVSSGDQYNLYTATNTNLNTTSSAQVQPSLVTPDADGYGRTMGISTSYINQPTVFIQNSYHALVQPSIGIAKEVQLLMPSSGFASIDKSAPSVHTSREDHDDSEAPINSKECYRPECRVCHKIFSCESTLRRHSIIHTNARPFQCEVCPSTFARRDYLKAHYNRVHLAMRRFQCGVCARLFYDKSDFDRHRCSYEIISG